jgi:hypothetical protein
MISFKTQNPEDNQGITEESYIINTYDDSDILYGIDILQNSLYPSIGCEYPCKECLSE